MKGKTLWIIVAVGCLLAIIGIYLYSRSRNKATSVTEAPDPYGIDKLISDNEALQEEIAAREQAAYEAGNDQAKKEAELRTRTALLTGGFSEIGRAIGIKW